MIQKRYIYFKHILYVLLFLLLYVLQTTPGLFVIGEVKPFLVPSLAVAIAVYEGDFSGGLYGILAGLLCDMAASTYFWFNAILLLLLCTFCGIITVLFIRQSWSNVMFLTAGVLFVRGILDFFFSYGLWGYEDTGWIFVRQVILCTLYSALLAPLFAVMVRGIKRFFDTRVNI